jgi:UDP-glucose 4-epimerase
MKLLITGGLGYIGSHLAIELKKNLDCEVILLDNLSSGKQSRNILNLDFEILDIRNQGGINNLFQRHQFDGVFHLAASKSIEQSIDSPGIFFDNNVVATLILLEAAKKFKVKNFIFASTCAVYGDLFVSKTGVDEESEVNPTNYYGETKVIAEKLKKIAKLPTQF